MKKPKSITRDLSIGSIGEQLLIKILTSAGMNPIKNIDKAQLKYFDVKASLKGNEVSFEVKYDLYSARSGNVAIEFYNPKSCINSGITATKADFWVHTFPGEEIWLAKTSNLIAFCARTKPLRIITAGGDDNSSMYLYKKDLILSDTFVKIDEINIVNTLEELLKMRVNIALIVSARNPKEKTDPFFLWSIPKVNIELTSPSTNMFDRASSLLKESVGIDGKAGWVILKFNNFYEVDNELYIVYTAHIPEKIPIKENYQWRSLSDTFIDNDCDKLDKGILLSIGRSL